MEFQVRFFSDCDAELNFKSQKIKCFSPKYLKSTYPNGGCKVRGEVSGKTVKNPIGTVQVGSAVHSVAPCGKHSWLLWRTAGYLAVGQDEFIALKKSRILFLILFIGLLTAGILLGAMLLKSPAGDVPGGNPGITPGENPGIDPGGNPDDGPTVIQPDHPLPPVDDNSQKDDEDDSQKADAPEGGGSLSMIYTLDATLNLTNKTIGIYFKNPNASSHNVTVDFYIVSGGTEYLIAQSGLLEAGYMLTKMDLLENAPTLQEGLYTGLYRLHCFDPVSGEQAMVVPSITGVSITVTN
jgi:hypothetical protein